MTRLHAEYQRLYLPPGVGPSEGDAVSLIGSDGRVRTLVLALGRPADWDALSVVWRGVQADLDLPAPAIAINGVDAFELWFSLAEPVPVAEASAFLQGLCQRYLPEAKPQRLHRWPAADAATPLPPPHTALIPAQHVASERWSAFVAPDLPSVFADDPSLDFQPGADAQAELLSRLTPAPAIEFQAALSMLRPRALALAAAPAPANQQTQAQLVAHGDRNDDNNADPVAPGPYQDPKHFLLDVMNDTSVALALRIEAAKALLPFTGKDQRG
jgi:hypothetical protein